MHVSLYACEYAEFLVNMKKIGWICMVPVEHMLDYSHGMHE